MIDEKILKHTQEKVRKLFEEFSVPAHGTDHVSRVVDNALKITKTEEKYSKLAEMSAWLHDIGRVAEFKDNPKGLTHHELSYLLAGEWFAKDAAFKKITKKEKEEILYSVRNHWDDTAKQFPTAAILRDADKLDLWGNHGLERHEEFNKESFHNLLFSLAYNLERTDRLETKAAKEILEKEKLLAPLEDFLKRNKPSKTKVLVAISGGVDSAVAAAILIKAGYQVTGAFMKCFSDKIEGNKTCWIDEQRDALRVAAKLGIKLITFDFEKEYRKQVMDYMYREYKALRTPNPDVMCNKHVKIPLLLKAAKKMGFDYIVTGHYALLKEKIISPKKKLYRLCQSVDKNKDQTYFLHQLGQKELSHLLFPLGKIAKNEVRVFAKKWELSVADKEESMGICFVGELPMRKFLMEKIKSKPGKVVLTTGEIIGEHVGLPFYTIGQRHSGLKLNEGVKLANKPLYVVDKNAHANKLIVGYEDDKKLFKKETILSKIHWIAGLPPKLPLECFTRARHRQELQKCEVRKNKKGYKIIFSEAQRALTPGQFLVLYKNGECLGGGEIE